jgi:hypothetical protein
MRNFIIVAGFAALSFMTPAKASAPWEAACAYKMPSGIPGQGWTNIADDCTRLVFCQKMENQGAADLSRMGCFGFTPEPSIPGRHGRSHG